VKNGLISCSWLHLLKVWSLLKTRGDSTLLVHCGPLIGGTELTQRLANKLIKPLILFDVDQPWPGQIEKTQAWLHSKLIRVLNVAGPSEERHPGIYAVTRHVLDQLFNKSK
jgi:hypothetical protein